MRGAAAPESISDKLFHIFFLLAEEGETPRGASLVRNYLYERRVAVYSTPDNKREHFVPRSTQDRAEFLRPARIAASLSSTPLVRASGSGARCWLLLR